MLNLIIFFAILYAVYRLGYRSGLKAGMNRVGPSDYRKRID